MFKNAIIYRITGDLNLSNINDQLANLQSREPGAIEYSTHGFVAPDRDLPDEFSRYINGAHFIRSKKIEKILPASVVNDYLGREVEEMESSQQRKISAKERKNLKDEVVLGLLPNAFTKPSYTDAFIDQEKGLVIVNASSFKKAEDLLSLLRKAMGSLPVVPLNVAYAPRLAMTRWVGYWVGYGHGLAETFSQGGKYSLVSGDSQSKSARFNEYESTEITDLIDNGAEVVSMSLKNTDLSFTLDEDLRIKGIKDIREIDTDEEIENQFESDCIVTHGLITKLVEEIIDAFGGEKQ
jgi:recombination associated protein RdgC